MVTLMARGALCAARPVVSGMPRAAACLVLALIRVLHLHFGPQDTNEDNRISLSEQKFYMHNR